MHKNHSYPPKTQDSSGDWFLTEALSDEGPSAPYLKQLQFCEKNKQKCICKM